LLPNSALVRQAFPGPLVLLLFCTLASMVSSLYIAAYAFYSMWKGFEVLVDVLTIAAILSYSTPQTPARAAYRMLLVLYGVLIIVYLIEAAAMPAAAFKPARGYLSIQ